MSSKIARRALQGLKPPARGVPLNVGAKAPTSWQRRPSGRHVPVPPGRDRRYKSRGARERFRRGALRAPARSGSANEKAGGRSPPLRKSEARESAASHRTARLKSCPFTKLAPLSQNPLPRSKACGMRKHVLEAIQQLCVAGPGGRTFRSDKNRQANGAGFSP